MSDLKQSSLIEVSEQAFNNQVLDKSEQTLVLVDFWATWCQPCQLLTPILEKLVKEYAGKFVIAKINADENQKLVLEYGVRGLPTVKLFKNRKVIGEFVGLQPESIIRKIIDPHIEKESDRILQGALQAEAQGNLQEAKRLLETAIQMDSNQTKILAELSRINIKTGDLKAAEAFLDRISISNANDEKVKKTNALLHFAKIAADEPNVNNLQNRVANNATDLDAKYMLSAHEILNENYESAMELLLAILQKNRKFKDDAGRISLLAAFDILNNSGPLVSKYRAKMSASLY